MTIFFVVIKIDQNRHQFCCDLLEISLSLFSWEAACTSYNCIVFLVLRNDMSLWFERKFIEIGHWTRSTLCCYQVAARGSSMIAHLFVTKIICTRYFFASIHNRELYVHIDFLCFSYLLPPSQLMYYLHANLFVLPPS